MNGSVADSGEYPSNDKFLMVSSWITPPGLAATFQHGWPECHLDVASRTVTS